MLYATARPPEPALVETMRIMRRALSRPDHADVGTLYIVLAIAAGLVGGFLSLCLRLPALDHGAALWRAVASQHGPVMVFFCAIPALIGGFGNWFAPLLVGARDTAFPRLALGSFGLALAGFLLTLAGLVPGHEALLLPALLGSGVAIVLCAANLVATLLNMRAPGMSLGAMPLFAWSQLIAGCLVVAAVPLLLAVLTRMTMGDGAAIPAWQALRILGLPGFCIMILPGFGLACEIVATLSGRPLAGRRLMITAMALLAIGGFLAWAHPLLDGGIAAATRLPAFSAVPVLLPALAMCGCCLATVATGRSARRVASEAPGLFILGFLLVLVAGGIDGLLFPSAPDGGIGAARLHAVLSLGAVFALFAGYYYWIGKMTGKSYPPVLARLQFWSLLPGVLMVMLPWSALSAAGAALTGLSVLLFVLVLAATLSGRRAASANPWGGGARTLEWQLPSPVPHAGRRA